MRVSVGNTLFAGSAVTFEGLQRKREQLLSLYGSQRYNHFGYDGQGRVNGSIAMTLDPSAIPQLGIPRSVDGGTGRRRLPLDPQSHVRNNDPPSTLTAPVRNATK